MEERIKKRFKPKILQEIIARFGIQPDNIEELDGFENFIYEFELDGSPFILRVAHSSRRSVPLILGEVDWINYLERGGALVARAIPSKDGNLVELVDDGHGEQFLATAFIKVQGLPPWEVGWTDERLQNFGRLIGQMHALTKSYQPSDPNCQRPLWEGPLIQDIERNLPPSERQILENYRSHYAHACSLPKESDSYGLIHFDANPSNFFIDEDNDIRLFDFDDCCYSWFINDIAIILFYMVMGEADAPGFTHHFMAQFLKGYQHENQLDPKWLVEIPNFLKLREIDLYAVILRDFGADTDAPWCARYLQGRKERLEKDIPYIDFDFSSLEKCLE